MCNSKAARRPAGAVSRTKTASSPLSAYRLELDSPARAAEGAKETLQISYRKFCGPCAGMVMAMDAAIAGAATGSNCSLSE
ncbi:hypothetical protein FHT76_005288 [Rhizobium sp. BK176]|nr:hypothetical protein [Rhizobium sp. BK181]MBB3543304.1 hypothetical protein [Rhizobium sp. BK399]MCS3741683.1 hypothetical protein [Rhizobium sp. BK661]MCS4093594.1 hypothetical protein [Rhizobium sp. BK176]